MPFCKNKNFEFFRSKIKEYIFDLKMKNNSDFELEQRENEADEDDEKERVIFLWSVPATGFIFCILI